MYRLYAIRYAHRDAPRYSIFNGHVERPTESLGMDYYTWLAVSEERVVGIDAGFTREIGEPMGRTFIASPLETMKRLGHDAADVSDLIITHFHYDHTGFANQFLKARYVLQAKEMAYWTGPLAGRGRTVDTRDIEFLVSASFKNRVRWFDGDGEVAPGITVHLVKGHTPGMQVVRVATARGPVVLAADASHYYENIEKDILFTTFHTTTDTYAAFDRVKELAGPDGLIVPGHDPLVMTRFPAVSDELKDLVVRLA